MIAEAFPGIDKSTLPSPDAIAEAFLQLCLEDCPHHGQVLDAHQLT